MNSGTSASIALPQFAYLTEEGSQTKIPVVVVQAEFNDADAVVMFGARDVNGKNYIATSAEISLLGRDTPKENSN
jgi:hypothetical protein